ncbi:hypothetical protein PM8797T_17122 [Gimesia maris DSM 8797]|nr:hypothetical protein PM8797T_17122 [Gimesia maris DSM 8797]
MNLQKEKTRLLQALKVTEDGFNRKGSIQQNQSGVNQVL